MAEFPLIFSERLGRSESGRGRLDRAVETAWSNDRVDRGSVGFTVRVCFHKERGSGALVPHSRMPRREYPPLSHLTGKVC